MKYDVTVIGSGPGGYVCAIRAAQLGMKTAIIERYATLGGTCLNVGCIPSKALLDSSEHYHNAHEKFAMHGIQLDNLKVDMPQMIKRKDEVVDQTCKGVEFLMKKNKIDIHHGHGAFVDAHTIRVTKEDGSHEDISSEKAFWYSSRYLQLRRKQASRCSTYLQQGKKWAGNIFRGRSHQQNA